jgi:hypothetical protein
VEGSAASPHATTEPTLRRFGFITTNSLPQVFNRRVVMEHLNATKDPLSLIFAIPDHPWLKSLHADDRVAAVRIAMTVAERGEHNGHLYRVTSEGDTNAEGTAVELSEQTGLIFADLQIGADVTSTTPLRANEDLSCRGVSLHGAGFIVTPQQAASLGRGRIKGLEQHIRPYLNGRDLTGISRDVMVIDLFGLSTEEVRRDFPEVYQWVHDRVKPERDQNRRATYNDNWWIFGEPRSAFRPALKGLSRYISIVETAKHRLFVFLDAEVLPDNKLVNFALADAFHLGVLSSKAHTTWALEIGSTLEDRPVYVKTVCFDPFPFPDCTNQQKQTIRDLAEGLDAHRKRQQKLYPWLTLTDTYNVLEKLRAGIEFNEQDQNIYQAGLIAILREIHDQLDRAVPDAYGWPQNLTTEQILERIVALNAERRAEEASGLIRWLRPEYQAPNAAALQTAFTGLAPTDAPIAPAHKQPWPATLTDQVRAVKDTLCSAPLQTPNQIAARFRPASRTRVAEILKTLTALGQTRQSEGRYSL